MKGPVEEGLLAIEAEVQLTARATQLTVVLCSQHASLFEFGIAVDKCRDPESLSC